MGRKKRYGAGYEIQHAERLFLQSVAEGEPEYRYVALAIGSTPGSPPPWAMFACIELRQSEELKAARGNLTDIPFILDELVRFYDHKQRDFESKPEYVTVDLDSYSPPSLRSAILHVLEANGLRGAEVGSADDNWIRDIREAWEWEQKHDTPLNPDPVSGMFLAGTHKSEDGEDVPIIKTTSRIERVLLQTIAKENGDPEDVHYWAWLAKQMIEQRNIRDQRAGQLGTDERSE